MSAVVIPPLDNPIRAGETGRRIRFKNIKFKWVSEGWVPTVRIRDPKNRPRTLDCEPGNTSNQSVCSFTTELNPFPVDGKYKIQLWFAKDGLIRKGKIHILKVEENI